MENLNVKIFTRSFDLRLYRYSRALYEDMGIPVVRLTDQSADGYFYTILKDKDCDIAINIDEDAFLVNPQAMLDLVSYVIDGGYANAGCPDGGCDALPRGGDPRVTNPFFNIMDLRQIRPSFDKSLLVSRLDDCEPYYPFFHWLADNFKTLYLPARKHPDGVTTILTDVEGRDICLHSWFARFYSMPSFMVKFAQRDKDNQKARIDALIKEAYAIRGRELPEFTAADKVAFVLNQIIRWVIKVPQRVSRWPRKIRRKILSRLASR